jgi:hypothetical protein
MRADLLNYQKLTGDANKYLQKAYKNVENQAQQKTHPR